MLLAARCHGQAASRRSIWPPAHKVWRPETGGPRTAKTPAGRLAVRILKRDRLQGVSVPPDHPEHRGRGEREQRE